MSWVLLTASPQITERAIDLRTAPVTTEPLSGVDIPSNHNEIISWHGE